jgi:RimJ/RimL family protein N-acetyltransferase
VTPDRTVDTTLRRLTADDAERVLGWMRDPEIAANVGLRREPSLAFTRDWLARVADDEGDTVARAVLADGVHVGNVVLDRIDRHLGTARLSIYLADRGRGVGVDATRAMLDFAFGPLGLRKVHLTVHEHNARAIRAYLRVGFREEGRLRGEFLLGDRHVDALYLGILSDEHRAGGASGP